MIRIPYSPEDHAEASRAELRFPDPSCNPYLAFAAMLAAGLDGFDKKLKCPPPVNNVNIFSMDQNELAAMNIGQLPNSLGNALDELAKDQIIRDALGPKVYDAFVRAKRTEWENYCTQVTDWEVEQYLETA